MTRLYNQSSACVSHHATVSEHMNYLVHVCVCVCVWGVEHSLNQNPQALLQNHCSSSSNQPGLIMSGSWMADN